MSNLNLSGWYWVKEYGKYLVSLFLVNVSGRMPHNHTIDYDMIPLFLGCIIVAFNWKSLNIKSPEEK